MRLDDLVKVVDRQTMEMQIDAPKKNIYIHVYTHMYVWKKGDNYQPKNLLVRDGRE